jgi:hypothetical protein
VVVVAVVVGGGDSDFFLPTLLPSPLGASVCGIVTVSGEEEGAPPGSALSAYAGAQRLRLATAPTPPPSDAGGGLPPCRFGWVLWLLCAIADILIFSSSLRVCEYVWLFGRHKDCVA